jgi:hypothetical protein
MVVEAEVIYKLAYSGADNAWFYLPLMSDLERMVAITLIYAQSSVFNYLQLALVSPSIRLGTHERAISPSHKISQCRWLPISDPVIETGLR